MNQPNNSIPDKTNAISAKTKKAYTMDFNKMRTNKNNNINISDNNCTDSRIKVYFDKLEEKLVEKIEQSTYVMGCVAWLTNPNIISALEDRKGVKIIINKEEYLNHTMEVGQKFFYRCLRGKYNEMVDLFAINCTCCSSTILQCNKFTKKFSGIITPDPSKSGAILTCGIVNNFSKMHHKFLIFFDSHFEALGVWTGSYNLSKTSNFSLENALYITDDSIIKQYINEFITIYDYSESYDWKSGVLAAPIKL